jgi:hypothetical protein
MANVTKAKIREEVRAVVLVRCLLERAIYAGTDPTFSRDDLLAAAKALDRLERRLRYYRSPRFAMHPPLDRTVVQAVAPAAPEVAPPKPPPTPVQRREPLDPTQAIMHAMVLAGRKSP